MRRLILATALAAASSPAVAQTAAELLPPRSVADPAREVAAPEAPGRAGPIAPGQAAGPGFVLKGVTVTGASVIPPAELAPIWAGLIGTTVDLAVLEDIAARISATYRGRGYVLSQAALPAQTVADGRVEIRVVEGFIDGLAVSGGKPNQQALAGRYFAPVPADRPLRLRTLERAVLLSRDTFGAEVETVLEPSPRTFGAADLGVAMTPDPVLGFAAIDNRGSRLYGDWTVSAGGTSYNLLGQNERIDGLVSLSPEAGKLAFGQLILDMPIPALLGTRLDGARFEALGEISRSDPDLGRSGAEGLSAVGREANLRAGLIVPFVRSRSENLFGRLNLGWRESENRTRFFGMDVADSTDRLVVLEGRLTWDIADRVGGVSLVDGAIRQGLDIGGAEVGGDGGGRPDFTTLRLNLTRLQRLDTAGTWSLWTEAMGQYATTVLPDAERFALGTASIGRGYAPGNTTGDSGLGARLELRRQMGESPAFTAAELYAFGDWGRAYDRNIARDGQQWETLASAGVGARLDVRDWLTLTPEVAWQLKGTPTDTSDDDRELRFFLGAIARF